MFLLSLVAPDTPNAKKKRPPKKMVALCLWIMRQNTFIIAIKSPYVFEKLSTPSTILKNRQ
jgi:hypothetical protein